jgi:hypothetical protein
MIKMIGQAIFTVLFFAACAAMMLYAIREDQDRDISIECSSCNSPFSWCPGYWKEHGLCSENKEETDEQELAKREVE